MRSSGFAIAATNWFTGVDMAGQASFSTEIIPGDASLDKLAEWAKDGASRFVRVGLPDTPHAGTELTLAHLGAIHEFGAPKVNIPERPFLHPAIREGQPTIDQMTRQLALEMQNGGTSWDIALERLGLLGQRLVQEKIRNGHFAPLKLATIKRKGSSKPLIDTGQLLSSVTYAVE